MTDSWCSLDAIRAAGSVRREHAGVVTEWSEEAASLRVSCGGKAAHLRANASLSLFRIGGTSTGWKPLAEAQSAAIRSLGIGAAVMPDGFPLEPQVGLVVVDPVPDRYVGDDGAMLGNWSHRVTSAIDPSTDQPAYEHTYHGPAPSEAPAPAFKRGDRVVHRGEGDGSALMAGDRGVIVAPDYNSCGALCAFGYHGTAHTVPASDLVPDTLPDADNPERWVCDWTREDRPEPGTVDPVSGWEFRARHWAPTAKSEQGAACWFVEDGVCGNSGDVRGVNDKYLGTADTLREAVAKVAAHKAELEREEATKRACEELDSLPPLEDVLEEGHRETVGQRLDRLERIIAALEAR